MENPTPGSEEAIRLGCTCAVIDNHYGKGFLMSDGEAHFWISSDCPLHGANKEPGEPDAT
jgi:hypothetical protein